MFCTNHSVLDTESQLVLGVWPVDRHLDGGWTRHDLENSFGAWPGVLEQQEAGFRIKSQNIVSQTTILLETKTQTLQNLKVTVHALEYM